MTTLEIIEAIQSTGLSPREAEAALEEHLEAAYQEGRAEEREKARKFLDELSDDIAGIQADLAPETK